VTMPNVTKKQLANLKSYKPGEERAKINGRKGGKAPKCRPIKQILQTFLAMDPGNLFDLDDKEQRILAALKEHARTTTKDLIWWKLVERAKAGDMNAMKMVADHIGEDPGLLLKVGGAEGLGPIKIDHLADMSIKELQDISNVLEKALDES